MRELPRAASALLLAPAALVLVPTAWSVLLAWLAPAAGLVVAARRHRTAAYAALAAWGILVALALLMPGLKIRGAAGLGGVADDDLGVASGFLALVVPAGLYLARASSRPRTRWLAGVGASLAVCWAAFFVSVPLASESSFAAFAIGAVLVAVALAWRPWGAENGGAPPAEEPLAG